MEREIMNTTAEQTQQIFLPLEERYCAYIRRTFNECLQEKGPLQFKFTAVSRFCSRGQIIIPACNLDYGVQLLETSGRVLLQKQVISILITLSFIKQKQLAIQFVHGSANRINYPNIANTVYQC